MKNKILELLPGVRTDIPLAPYTSFRIGGRASYFFIAKNKQAVQKAVATASTLKMPFFILGEGTNILVADKGYRGLVILMRMKHFKLAGNKLYAEAGVPMHSAVKKTGSAGLSGLEWAGGLPGTVGGAVRGNAGAFGGEIKDAILEVELLDEQGRIRRFSKKQCQFEYRSSAFARASASKKKNLIVLSASFRLQKGDRAQIMREAKDHIRYRKEKHPLEYPNAGSMFKNCDLKKIPKSLYKMVKEKIKIDPFPVVPTAFLLAEAKLKGMRQGKAQISEKHPNYIVNRGKAKAKDVVRLIKKMKRAVQKKFSVALEEEIQIL